MEVSKTDKVESYLRARGILSTGITHFNTLQMSVSHKKVKRAARTVKLEARKMHLRYLDLTDPKISNAVAKYLKDAQDGVYDSVNPFGALWTPE